MLAFHTDIAVIGAGLAGVSCARQLAAAGYQVQLFDKSKGMGGRMATRRGEQFAIDHGAQYFTARHPDFIAEVARWLVDGRCAAWTGQVVQWHAQGQTPAYPEQRYVPQPGMSSLCRSLADGLDVALGQRLVALQRQEQGWQLSFADDQPAWLARQVLLAVPPAQAAALLGPAPELQALAASVAMEPCWAAMLELPDRLPLPIDAAWVEHGPIRWLARNTSKPGRTGREGWVIHATPAWSQQQLDTPAEQVAALLHAAFADLVDVEVEVSRRSAHRWLYGQAANPLTLGQVYAADIGLGLCGDWCLGTRIEDAWLSGQALAMAVRAAGQDSVTQRALAD